MDYLNVQVWQVKIKLTGRGLRVKNVFEKKKLKKSYIRTCDNYIWDLQFIL